MTNPDRFPWAAFLGGTWQKTRPVRPGCYFVADRSGVVRGVRHLVTDKFDRVIEPNLPQGEPGWQGWWWSMPVPDAPTRPVPEWV